MWILTILLYVFIIGFIVFIHELGHFIYAKMFGVHIYEFSIGMGPIIIKKTGKDGINYNVRALPIGGFVSMAGEVYEDDKKIKKEKCLCNKPIWQRLIVIVAGVVHNALLAFILFVLIGSIYGSYSLEPVVDSVTSGSAMENAGIVGGDTVLAINGTKVHSLSELQTMLAYKDKDNVYEFRIKHVDGSEENYKIKPTITENEDGTESRVFGVYFEQEETKGFISKIKYGIDEIMAAIRSTWLSLKGLIMGKISVSSFMGPVGVYTVVEESVSVGAESVLYLMAFLSINVAVINILPFPAVDGGRILFILIEKIKGSPVNQKFENICHTIGFALLLLLMLVITIGDIIRLF